MVLATSENMPKIKSMVMAHLYIQMDQDMKVKCSHEAELCGRGLLGLNLSVYTEIYEKA